MRVYKSELQVGGAAAETKFWKEKELNLIFHVD